SLPATSPVVVPFLSFPWFRSRRALHPFPTRRSSDLSLPIRQFGSFHPGNGIGGAGIHWAAQTWRFYPSDMRYRSHHVERYGADRDRKSTRLNSSHVKISYAVFCLKKKKERRKSNQRH